MIQDLAFCSLKTSPIFLNWGMHILSQKYLIFFIYNKFKIRLFPSSICFSEKCRKNFVEESLQSKNSKKLTYTLFFPVPLNIYEFPNKLSNNVSLRILGIMVSLPLKMKILSILAKISCKIEIELFP